MSIYEINKQLKLEALERIDSDGPEIKIVRWALDTAEGCANGTVEDFNRVFKESMESSIDCLFSLSQMALGQQPTVLAWPYSNMWAIGGG